MKERPILMSAPMVRAILDGTKTQTRRTVRAGNSLVDGRSARGLAELGPFGLWRVDAGPSPAGNPGPYLKAPNVDGERVHRVYSRVQPGDRLWVRETFYCDDFEYPNGNRKSMLRMMEYRASHRCADWESDCPCTPPRCWRPSIHMPRWASRITLEVTSVRVERVQGISEEDARAEGVSADDISRVGTPCYSARQNFERLWASINGRESWDADPWVWVVSFERVTP